MLSLPAKSFCMYFHAIHNQKMASLTRSEGGVLGLSRSKVHPLDTCACSETVFLTGFGHFLSEVLSKTTKSIFCYHGVRQDSIEPEWQAVF